MASKDANQVLRVPKTTVFRGASGKCIAIELNSGRIFYFSSETEPFLELFKSPRRLATLEKSAGLSADESEYIRSFCQFLLKKGLLETVDTGAEESQGLADFSYRKPQFLSESEKTIEEISFACP